jgi:hypothetical protein
MLPSCNAKAAGQLHRAFFVHSNMELRSRLDMRVYEPLSSSDCCGMHQRHVLRLNSPSVLRQDWEVDILLGAAVSAGQSCGAVGHFYDCVSQSTCAYGGLGRFSSTCIPLYRVWHKVNPKYANRWWIYHRILADIRGHNTAIPSFGFAFRYQ